jgi:hypothetical protein
VTSDEPTRSDKSLTPEPTVALTPSHSCMPITLDDDIQAALRLLLIPSLPIPDQAAFNAATAFEVSRYKISNNTIYSSFDKSLANSLIYFRNFSDSRGFSSMQTCDLVPAKIRLIFQHYRKVGQALECEIFVALHRFQPVELQRDPFISYPDFRARLYHKEPLPAVTIIRIHNIHCHANSRPWDASSVVMRAIDRV